jgi:hypothetical protein
LKKWETFTHFALLSWGLQLWMAYPRART